MDFGPGWGGLGWGGKRGHLSAAGAAGALHGGCYRQSPGHDSGQKRKPGTRRLGMGGTSYSPVGSGLVAGGRKGGARGPVISALGMPELLMGGGRGGAPSIAAARKESPAAGGQKWGLQVGRGGPITRLYDFSND